jgi:hypothetical protein
MSAAEEGAHVVWKRLLPGPFKNTLAAALWGLLVAACALALAVGFAMPDKPDGIAHTKAILLSSGAVGAAMLIFIAAYLYASTMIADASTFLRNVMAAAGPAAITGAILYGFCVWNDVPEEGSNHNTHDVLERFGRFVFFAYPAAVGIALAIQSALTLRVAERSEVHPAAVLVMLFAALQVILTAVFSAKISEIGLAAQKDGKVREMGDMQPVLHLGLTVLLFVSLFTLLRRLERRDGQSRAAKRIAAFLMAIQPIAILTLVVTCLVALDHSSSKFFPPGTGIGLLTVCAITVLSIVMIAAMAQPK